jgi:hypothetical protein
MMVHSMFSILMEFGVKSCIILSISTVHCILESTMCTIFVNLLYSDNILILMTSNHVFYRQTNIMNDSHG